MNSRERWIGRVKERQRRNRWGREGGESETDRQTDRDDDDDVRRTYYDGCYVIT